MPNARHAGRLEDVPLFARMSKKERELIVKQADEMTFPDGFTVLREGDSGNEFWLVVSGTLSVRRGGDEVDQLAPGDWFGELAVIDPAPRNATIVATSPVTLLVLGRQRFWDALQQSPTLMRKVIIGLARRLREMDAADTEVRRRRHA
jgi:CRP-like cAMP-binding protein